MKTRLPKGCALALSLALGAAALCRAERLPRADWVVKDADGQVLSRATDNDLATAAVIEGSALSPLAFTIDLGRPCVIHRFYLTGGPAAKAPPAKPAEGPGLLEAPPLPRAPYPARLTLFAGDAPDRMAVVATAPIPTNTGTDVRFEADVRFPPVAARCLRVVAADKAEGLRWSIAEMEILGSTRQEAFAPPDAVVVATNAPFPLQLGAQDMSYYLGEMTGVPLPIVAPAESDKYPGTLYCVETPAPLPPYEDLVKQPLPDFERVDVRRDGRKVVFGGVIPRTVLFGVYAFLDAQGVRWLAPESLGDFVPARPKVDLAVLPLDFAPSIKTRHFSGNSQAFFSRTSETYLWLWRNRWNMTWGWEYNEIIGALPWPRKSPSFGHPHSLTELVPAGLYTNHPDWFPYYREDSPYRDRISGKRAWHPHPLGQRVPYDTTWGLNPCLSNTGVVNYVAEQIVSNTIPRDAYALCTVSPLDAGVWCECDACRALDVDLTPEWLIRWGDRIISDRYFGFVAKVARQIAPAVPHVQILALA